MGSKTSRQTTLLYCHTLLVIYHDESRQVQFCSAPFSPRLFDAAAKGTKKTLTIFVHTVIKKSTFNVGLEFGTICIYVVSILQITIKFNNIF